MVEKDLKYAVVIPCLNEEETVGKVISDFRKVLPQADIYIIENDSEDNTYERAVKACAKVIKEPKKGKGNAVRRICSDIVADIYILVDGDDTYYADDIYKLLGPVLDGKADMVIGSRLDKCQKEAFHTLNWIGNGMIRFLFNICFKTKINDLLSGYRVMTKRLVHSIPMLTTGFEIETEITLQAMERQFKVLEVPVKYNARPDNSKSKLKPFRDGLNIAFTILLLMRDYRPLTFFGSFAILFFLVGTYFSGVTYFNSVENGEFQINVSFIICLISFLLSSILFIVGLIIGSNQRRFRELEMVLRNITRAGMEGNG